MKIQSMESPRTGKAVANQFVIVETGGEMGGYIKKREIFQSYDSVIAKRISYEGRNADIILDATYWNYSKTTSKYRSQFLGETTKETQEKIDNGTYTLANLN